MKISRQWIEAFLRRPLDARDMASRLAMLGAPVDSIESTAAALAPFVVALVTEAVPHPDADKLRVTKVDDGSGTIHTVVCGAPNVVAGAKYPFARLGTVMPGGLVIERRKIRGQASEGMLCSARELGLGDDHDGILTLTTEAAPGTPLLQVLNIGDDCLEVDVTPNRPDLLGHKGVARELAASYGVPYRLPEIPGEVELDLPTPTRHGAEATVGGIALSIGDTNGCPRFLGAVIRDVKIAPSPEWLQQRLRSIGLRSINNVVDATNYVMLELNQPMHAYDASTLRGSAISARPAREESIITLDGTTRKIPTGALVIADAERAIGIAGVMGGRDTEVTGATSDIFLECAFFDTSRVRKARRAVGLSTDASYRFERGTDRWGAVDAFRRCIRLIVTVAGGQLDGNTVDCFPEPTFPPRIFLRPARVRQVLGLDLQWKELEQHLVAIGATVVSKPDDERIAVDVPGWRPDIIAEIDLIEEIARLHGYDAISSELSPFRPGSRPDDEPWAVAERIRAGLAAHGLSEAVTLPMIASGGGEAIRVKNPLSADHSWLRDAILPSLVRQVEANWTASIGDIRLFEVGTVFSRAGKPGAPPVERESAAFVVTGGRAPAHWSDGGKRASYDRWDALALFERLAALAHPGATIEVAGDRWEAKDRHGRLLGWCGRCEADAPAWAHPLFGGEIAASMKALPAIQYLSLPAFPAVQRDIALLLGLDQAVAVVSGMLVQRGKRHGLESVAVIDEYRGTGLPAGKRSVALRLVFRAGDRTLTDVEVEAAVVRLLTSLERELDVTLRTT